MLAIHWTSAVFYFFIILCCLLTYVSLEDDPKIPRIAEYFNTKGRYEEVNKYLRDDILAINRSILHPPSANCREIYLTAIIRHGTRYPTTKSIKEIQQLYSIVLHNASGEKSRLREIKSQWTMWYTEDMDGRLVQKGVSDLKHLAIRLSKLFPSLVSEEKLRGGFIQFITSSKHRCVNSTLSFKAVMTELWDIKDQDFDHAVNDSLMRFFDKCPRIVQEVDNNSSAMAEVNEFKQGPEMRRVQEKIADRLSVPCSLITHDMAEAAFYLCTYEFAIKEVNSPWCQLFDEEDAKVMEYASDLREFWKRGHGYDINRKSSCILFHDVFHRLNQAASAYNPGQCSESIRLLCHPQIQFAAAAILCTGWLDTSTCSLLVPHTLKHPGLSGCIMPITPWKLIVVHLITVTGFSCCFRNDVIPEDDPRIPAIAKYFSTKGRYEEVNPHLIEDILAVNRSVLQPPFAQCREIHVTAIIRHGTRYPTVKNIKKMQKLYELVKSSANGKESWLREIKSQWTMWYTEDMDGRLVQKGVSDHKHLAVRLSKLFPSLVSEEKLRGGFIQFITSSKHRCVNSTLSFKAGLTELWDIKDQEFDHAVNDALMRFFDQCTRFLDEVDNNPTALTELDKFKQGPEMRRVQEKIADRLGVPYNSVTDVMAEAAFYMCAYEFAIKTVNSPWCRLFDEVDAKVMEYANDLKQFWKRSYGYDINSKSSCTLFHDVFSRLNKAANENQSGQQVTEAVTVQVGHAETLLPLLTLLGFFKDSEALTSTNYATQTERSFRTSHMLPYAANLLLVLYDCGGGDLRLQPLLNEKPVTFPGLTEQQASMPLYQDVKAHYRELIQGCDFETECQLFKNPAEL